MSRPLRDIIPEILKHVRDTEEIRRVAKSLKTIKTGNIADLVEERIRSTYSPSAKKHSLDRLTPVNVIAPMVDKLSIIYESPPTRTTSLTSDQELLDDMIEELDLDDVMSEANNVYELQDFVAMEPYFYNRKLKLRVLEPTQFTALSTDLTNPNEADVLIKFMGECNKVGSLRSKTRLMFIYSDTEFIALDGDGKIRQEYMQDTQGLNPYGVLPVIFIKRERTQLLRDKPNRDLLELGLNVPLLFTDLSYGIKFSAFSVFTINGAKEEDIAGLSYSPNAIWSFSNEDDSKPVTVNTIKPDIDIPSTLQYIAALTRSIFSSRGIKTTVNEEVELSASGLSKLVSEADVSSAISKSKVRFKAAELSLLWLISKMQNYGADGGLIDDARKFSESFRPTVEFPKREILQTESERIATIQAKKEAGLTSSFRALREVHKDLPESEVVSIQNEINRESSDE